jgi:hypothetical protein
MKIGVAYTAKDIQAMFTESAPYSPVTRKEAKQIVYGILRAKCYITQASDAHRKGVILQLNSGSEHTQSTVPSFIHAFNRACLKVLRCEPSLAA